MIDSRNLIGILKAWGVNNGATLLFEAPHLERDSVQGGFDDLTAGLQALLGNGLLVVPTCTPPEGRPQGTFDPTLSPSQAGPFSEFFRKLPEARRSHNATHSLAALGPDSDHLVAGHRAAAARPSPWGEGAFGKGSPWDILYQGNAWWVMLDSCWESSPFIGYLRAVFSEQSSGVTKRTPFIGFDPSALAACLRHEGLLKESSVDECQITAFRVKDTLDAALTLLRERLPDLRPDRETADWRHTADRVRQHGYLRVGIAKRAITPSIPCLRWDGKKLSGVYRDLYSRVLVLSYQERTVALVLCDLLGIRRDLVEAIRRRAHELSGISPDDIFLSCTHAHSTPDTTGAGYEDEAYLQRLVDTVSSAIADAAADRQPGRMGWGRVPIRGLAASRRIQLTDGRVFTTRYSVPSTWSVDPGIIASHGHTDPDLTVLRFEDLDGRVLAVWSNFGCHPSVALTSSNISGDFAGESMTGLERLLGEPAVVLCTNGAAGDVDPTLEMPFWGPRTDASARRLGNIFAAQVLECMERIEVKDEVLVRANLRPVDLPVRPEWIRLLHEERERMQQEFAGTTSLSPAVETILSEGVIHTEVHAVRLGELAVVGLPGEVFADTALALKADLAPLVVAIVELAGDDIGYIGTREAFTQGGYEVGIHFWGRVNPDAESVFRAEASAAVKEVMTSSS